jgi:hydrogenase nickel incorporation protein HypB
MCGTCGCGESDVRVEVLAGGRAAAATVEHGHSHGHDPVPGVVEIETALLAKNDHLARHNRAWLAERGIVALNLMSSPGSGKTSLLRRTIDELAPTRPIAVIEGDQETHIDAEKIRSTGAPVVQINTGAGCHLDADMLARGLAELSPLPGSLVFVENVGNLVVINKIDLLPYVDVRLEHLVAHCRSVNAGVRVLPLSVTTGEGMEAWGDWLLTCEPVAT